MSYESRWRKYFLIKFLLCVCKNHVFIAAIGKNGMTEGKKCSKQQQQWWWWWQPDYRKPGELKTFIAHLHVTWPSIAQHPIHYSQVLTAHQQRQRRRSHAPPAPAVVACTCFPVTSLLWLSAWDIRRDADTSYSFASKVSRVFVRENGTRWSESPTTRERKPVFSCQVRKLLTLVRSIHRRWEEMENYQQNHNSDNENRICD